MTIKIPSKNIYQISNPKIRDNVIDNVSVEQTVITPSNDYETPVYNYKTNDFEEPTYSESGKIKYVHSSSSGIVGQYRYELSASWLDVQTIYSVININFGEILKNSYISKVYDKKNNNNENNIKYTVHQEIKEEEIEADFTINSLGEIQNVGTLNLRDVGEWSIYEVLEETITNGTNAIPQDFINLEKEKVIISQNIDNSSANIENSVEQEYEENVSYTTIKYENGDYYLDGLKILCGLVVTNLSYTYNSSGVIATPPSNTIRFKGKRTTYTPTSLEITIYGDTIGIDLTDGSVIYGGGNKPYSLSRNELLQDSLKSNGILTTKHLANNILSQYENGKESATLLCDINDYYFYDNPKKKAISPYSANYIEFPYNGKVQENGILFTVLEDGGICLNGQNNGQGNSAFWLYNNYYASGGKDNKIFNKGTYTFSELGNNVKFVLWCDIGYFSVGGKAHTFAEDTKPRALYIEVGKGTQTIYDNYIIYPMMAFSGEKPFEIGYPMFFKEHDEVIPMVLGANGKDYPMSKHQDGTPKVFEVVNTNLIYDGAVWQELILLEKSK